MARADFAWSGCWRGCSASSRPRAAIRSRMLEPSGLAPGLHLGEDVELGEGLTIGAHVTIHAGTRVGDGCVIEDGAVLGKVPRLARRSRARRDPPPPLVLDSEVTVCAGAVVFAGATVG